MCKYINFNDFKKKKGFVGEGVVVGWSSPLWKYKKTAKKIQKEERENTKNNLLFEQWKTMKTFFYYSQKSGFWEHKKQKHTPFLKQVFLCFLFSRTENSSWKQEPNRPLDFPWCS